MSGFSLMYPPRTLLLLLLKVQKLTPLGILVTIGCSHHQVCAYCSLVAYLKILGFTNNFQITRPLFVLTCGKTLHNDLFISHIKTLVASLGLDQSQFLGHSLRSGSATTAGLHSFNDYELKQLGHWSSNVYQCYLHPSDHQIAQFAACLSNSQNQPL